MPPSRYRVVERGRRLEVVDTANDGRARQIVGGTRPKEPGESAPVGWLPRQVRFDGTKRWTTHPLYDAKGPRTVTIVPGASPVANWLGIGAATAVLASAVALAPWALLPIAAVLFNPKARAQLRGWSTRVVDRIDAAS